MIPVPQGVYKRIDINNDKYKDYLNNEYIYLKKQSTREEIERKINNVVNAVFVKKDEFWRVLLWLFKITSIVWSMKI